MSKFAQNFSVDSALLQELGERLVTTPHVALAELVKNSYDADATEVHVSILDDRGGGPRIEVRDNGHGMTLEQIKAFWMRIGTTHKEDEKFSPKYGRPLTGSKGIGRFCVRRLGTKVHLEAAAIFGNHNEHNTLEIDWTKFSAGEDVSQIKVEGTTQKTEKKETGLKLIMTGHKRIEWRYLEDRRSYGYLLRQLATLTANRGAKRAGYKQDPGFKVFLEAPGLDLISSYEDLVDDEVAIESVVDIRERLMDAGWAQLTAYVGENGRIVCNLDAAQPVGKRSFISAMKFNDLKDVSLRLSIFVDEPGWNRNDALVPKGKLKLILDDWGGVQLRYRDMRIFPYGDPGDDWLEIEKDRARRLGRPPQDDLVNFAHTIKANTQLDPGRVLLNMLSHKAFLGAVEIGINQKGLTPKADREGFVENNALKELRQFARFAIDWAMIWRDYAVKERERLRADKFRRELEVKTDGKPIPPAEQSKVALRIIRESVTQLRSDPSTITTVDIDNIASAASLLESEIKISKSDLLRFQLVASASTLSLLYHHEIKYLSQSLTTLAAELSDALNHLKGTIKVRCGEVLKSVESASESLSALTDLTQDMGILDRKSIAGRLDLASQTERAVSRFQRVANAYKIDISQKIEEGMQVGPMLKGELAAILLNVLSNAIKAVIAGAGPKRLIELQAYVQHRKVCLEIKDNGIGLNTHERSIVFTPLVSDPSSQMYDYLEERLAAEDRHLLGQGSGLGLSIVRGILENRKGTARFLDPQDGWKTRLYLELPTP